MVKAFILELRLIFLTKLDFFGADTFDTDIFLFIYYVLYSQI